MYYTSSCPAFKSLGMEIPPFIAYPAKLIYINFQPLEVVSRCRDPQPTSD